MSRKAGSLAAVLAATLLVAASLAGCGSSRFPSKLDGTLPRKGSIVPDTVFQVTPQLAIPLEKIVYWGIYAGIAYLVIDPLAPNWEIEEARLSDNHVHLALKMKRVHNGGDGEARAVFNRRARDLAHFGGFAGYQVLEYQESLESSVLGSQRRGEGVVVLTGKREG